jgi:hypothetical protein
MYELLGPLPVPLVGLAAAAAIFAAPRLLRARRVRSRRARSSDPRALHLGLGPTSAAARTVGTGMRAA